VSVVIPACNAAAWIGESIGSVLAQSYPRALLEVVVVDDGSTDSTGTLAAAALHEAGFPAIVLRNGTPLGPSAARNRGWRAARGTWIQFLDADDLLAPDKIERQAAEVARAPDALAAVFSRWAFLIATSDGASPDDTVTDPAIGDDALVDLLRADNFMATGSQLFSRLWLERVNGYVESYRLIEDVDLLMRLVIAGGILTRVHSDAPLFWYRRRAGSASTVDRRAFVDAQIRNARTAEAHWRAAHALTAARASVLAELYFDAARFLAEHDPPAFDEIVSHIQTLEPGFMPPRPQGLRWLTQLVGYRRAERAAVGYRRLKRLADRSTS
jgi:glycosyltransferase involved in cell wall biosynthesis